MTLNLGAYTMGTQVGMGGMGTVFEGAAPDGTRVAIKVLNAERRADTYALRRFQDEAIAGLCVSHPNVVSTVAFGSTDDGVPFLVLEWVQGELLGARIHSDRLPSLMRAAVIVRQLLAGIGAMHAAGIVHGDIKSDNVLIETQDDGSDVAKLIDLGLSRVQLLEHEAPAESPAEIVVAGTPEYMAPEVVMGRGTSRRSDIYSTGVVLYELITGTTPFSGHSLDEVFDCQCRDPLVPPSVRRPGTPEVLDRVVARALHKDPMQRYASAAAFSSALLVAMTLLDEEPYPPRVTFSREGPTQEWSPSRVTPFRRRIARGTPSIPERSHA